MTSEEQIDIVKKNPRSSTVIRNDHFIKTSDELVLNKEAQELERCQINNLCTSHVTPPEFVSFDRNKNELTTRYIPASQSLYNAIWNGTSLMGRIRGKTLDLELLLARSKEIGEWLKQYHNTTPCPEKSTEVAATILSIFKNKVDALRRKRILTNDFLNKIENHYYPEIERITDPQYQKNNSIHFCQIHADFIVHNMMVDNNWNIHILDFADTRIGATIEDIGRYYEQLWAMLQTNKYRRPVISQALSAFLEGYGLPDTISTTPFMLAIRALNGLIHCISDYTQQKYLKYLFLTRIELRQVTRISLRRLTQEV